MSSERIVNDMRLMRDVLDLVLDVVQLIDEEFVKHWLAGKLRTA